MTQIAIVDDDDLFRESVEKNLSDAGYDVIGFEGGQALLDFYRQGGDPDLVLIDWKMPGLTGIEVLRQLRGDGVTAPTIFLTILSDQVYEEAALATGAVDFVEKSRSFHILRRRMELILEGMKGGLEHHGTGDGPGDSEVCMIGALELRVASGRAAWRGIEVPLTLNEFKIVYCLALHAGQDMRYRDLYDQVRGSGFAAGIGLEGYKTNVRTFIKRIRQKFRSADPSFDRIENYPGFGYRWRDE